MAISGILVLGERPCVIARCMVSVVESVGFDVGAAMGLMRDYVRGLLWSVRDLMAGCA